MQSHLVIGWCLKMEFQFPTLLLGEWTSFMLDNGVPYVMMDFCQWMLLHCATFLRDHLMCWLMAQLEVVNYSKLTTHNNTIR